MIQLFSKKPTESKSQKVTEPKNGGSLIARIDQSGSRKLRGVVVSDKMKKTVVVEVSSVKLHPKYKKYYKVSKRFKAHDENNEYHIGDKVVIQETRPLSKEKGWVVVSKLT